MNISKITIAMTTVASLGFLAGCSSDNGTYPLQEEELVFNCTKGDEPVGVSTLGVAGEDAFAVKLRETSTDDAEALAASCGVGLQVSDSDSVKIIDADDVRLVFSIESGFLEEFDVKGPAGRPTVEQIPALGSSVDDIDSFANYNYSLFPDADPNDANYTYSAIIDNVQVVLQYQGGVLVIVTESSGWPFLAPIGINSRL